MKEKFDGYQRNRKDFTGKLLKAICHQIGHLEGINS